MYRICSVVINNTGPKKTKIVHNTQLSAMAQVLQEQQSNTRTQTSSPTCYWGSNAGTMAADHASMELRVMHYFSFLGPVSLITTLQTWYIYENTAMVYT